jgi:hypothetical protein
MLKEQAGRPEEQNGKHLEQQHCETVREIYQTLYTSSLEKFTYSRIDSVREELHAIVQRLESLPEEAFKEMIEVIDGLREARNELRLAMFLFNVEEIHPVHRLVMRNRAVLRGREILHKVLRIWPEQFTLERHKVL